MEHPADTANLESLKEKYLNGDLTRRSFLKAVGIAGLSAGVFTLPSRVSAQTSAAELIYHGWGGAPQEAMRKMGFSKFEESTDTKVIEGTFGGEEEAFAKAKASPPGAYNIIASADIFWYKMWIDAGFGVVLNESNIPNIQNVMPALLAPFRKVTPEGLSAVPFSYGTTGIAYNKKYISPEEATSQREMLFLNPELDGKLSGYNDFQSRIWIAACQTQQDPNNISDLDAVWKKIRENYKLMRKYWNSGANSVEMMAAEEVYACDMWSGRAVALMARSPDFGYVEWSKNYCWTYQYLVVKGASVELAEQFINFMLDADVTIAVAEAQYYPPPLDPTKIEFSDEIKALPDFDPTGTLERFVFADAAYWTKHAAAWKPIYARIAKGF